VDKGLENLGQELSMMNVNTMKEGEIEGDDKKTHVGYEEEALPQLAVHTLEEVSTKTFVHKLAQGKKFQNGVTQEALVLFKM
jgi:hypothetical protein